MKKPVVLKLGGSVITDKSREFTPNLTNISRLAKEIYRSGLKSLVLVHGGGSYGHPLAFKYGFSGEGVEERRVEGVSEIHLAMSRLNNIVTEEMIKAGVKAVGVHPSSCIVARSGKIELFEDEPIKGMLRCGLIPILFGDVVFDLERRFTIISGDQIVSTLAVKLNSPQIIIGTDVDGLYTRDPKLYPDAKLIRFIRLSELEEIRESIGESTVTDVTMGMYGKVNELLPAIERGVTVKVINATVPDRLFKALKNMEVLGTVIVRG